MLAEAKAIRRLRLAFRRNNLTIYLGAGVSATSGVPTWHDLVLTVYLNSLRIQGKNDPSLLPFIQAIATRWFAQNPIPLEVASRALRTSFRDAAEFLHWVRFGLYQNFEFDSHGYPTQNVQFLIRRNQTLKSVGRLCRHTRPGDRGLRAVITYNLDGLLEMALGAYPFQAIWKHTRAKSEALPIYHVHGYVPVRDPFRQYSQRLGSAPEEIVLTEDEYHQQAMDPYSWANLVQLQAMSSSVGLAIGLSLSDPNMRRLLDAANRTPHRPEFYALLQKPELTELEESGLQEIANETQRVRDFYRGFFTIPIPGPDVKSSKWRDHVQRVWLQLERVNLQRQVTVMRELGIVPIWCQYTEIPSIINSIINDGPTCGD